MAQSGFLKSKRPQMAIQSHLRANQVEQITGIEPASSAWEADILTIVLYLQLYYMCCNICNDIYYTTT